MNETKICTLCGETKLLEEFTKHRRMKDGLSYWCRECNNKRTKAFRKSPSGIYTQIKSRLKFREVHSMRRGLPKYISISRVDFIDWYKNAFKICEYCEIKEEDLSKVDDSHNNKVFRLTIDCKDNSVGYAKENLVLSCLRCNGIKNDLFFHETMREIGRKYIKPIWKKKLAEARRLEPKIIDPTEG